MYIHEQNMSARMAKCAVECIRYKVTRIFFFHDMINDYKDNFYNK